MATEEGRRNAWKEAWLASLLNVLPLGLGYLYLRELRCFLANLMCVVVGGVLGFAFALFWYLAQVDNNPPGNPQIVAVWLTAPCMVTLGATLHAWLLRVPPETLGRRAIRDAAIPLLTAILALVAFWTALGAGIVKAIDSWEEQQWREDSAFENWGLGTASQFFQEAPGAKSTTFYPTRVFLLTIGDAVTITVQVESLYAQVNQVRIPVQYPPFVEVSAPACVGIFEGGNASSQKLANGTILECFLPTGRVNGVSGRVMTFVLSRTSEGVGQVTFYQGGGYNEFYGLVAPGYTFAQRSGLTNTLEIISAPEEVLIGGNVTLTPSVSKN
ncbi:MAG: hypothetical protein HY680_03580 [Chloroflexi bacterium]|nr:hypothetical protein [Chloroflexota bacterium]